jgi:hypothetical protein
MVPSPRNLTTMRHLPTGATSYHELNPERYSTCPSALAYRQPLLDKLSSRFLRFVDPVSYGLERLGLEVTCGV